MSLAVVRDLRDARAPAGPDELAAFETDVLAGFVLARAAAGLSDNPIRSDVLHLEQLRAWFGRPLWDMEPADADAYFGTVLRDAARGTRLARSQALKTYFLFLEIRHKVEIHQLTGRVAECPVDEMNRPRGAGRAALRIPPSAVQVGVLFAGWRAELATCRKFAPAARSYAAARLMADVGLRVNEVSHLDLADVKWDLGRFGKLHVRLGKGARGSGPRERMVPLIRPIEWGADIVIHSATKFIGGHGTSIGGVVVEAGTFDWSNGRFPVVADPSPAYHGLQFHETFGTYGYLMKLRAETLRDLGAALSPFNAFLFLLGLETLSLRMERHVDNARVVAAFLESHDLASNVTYPGTPGSKYRPLVEKYLPRGAGAVFSFDCAGGRDGGQDLIRGVTLWSHLANVGDAKSLIIHPASTTHRQLGDDELRAAGVGPGTVRLSVGTESVEDLIWDLQQGFALVAATAGKKAATK